MFAPLSAVGSQTGMFHGGASTWFELFDVSRLKPCGLAAGHSGSAATGVKIALVAENPVTLNSSSWTGSEAFPGTVNETRMSPTTRLKSRVKDEPSLAFRLAKLVGAFFMNSKPQKWVPSLSPTCPPRCRTMSSASVSASHGESTDRRACTRARSRPSRGRCRA